MGARYRIHGDHARRRDIRIVDIGVSLPGSFRDRFVLQPAGIDEAVAPKASLFRRDHSADAEHASDRSVLRDRDFGAHLDARNAILVHDCVEQQPRAHRVRCEKHEIAVGEARRDVVVQKIPGQGLNLRLRIRSAYVAGRHPDLRASQPGREGVR